MRPAKEIALDKRGFWVYRMPVHAGKNAVVEDLGDLPNLEKSHFLDRLASLRSELFKEPARKKTVYPAVSPLGQMVLCLLTIGLYQHVWLNRSIFKLSLILDIPLHPNYYRWQLPVLSWWIKGALVMKLLVHAGKLKSYNRSGLLFGSFSVYYLQKKINEL